MHCNSNILCFWTPFLFCVLIRNLIWEEQIEGGNISFTKGRQHLEFHFNPTCFTVSLSHVICILCNRIAHNVFRGWFSVPVTRHLISHSGSLYAAERLYGLGPVTEIRNLTSLWFFYFGLTCWLLELLPFLLSAQLLTSYPMSYSEHICLLFLFWISTSSGKFYTSFKYSSSDSNYFWACPIYFVNFFLMLPLLPVFCLAFSCGALVSISGTSFCVLSLPAIRKNKSLRAI